MASIEYLNPYDWSLHVINPDNDAVPEDWVLVPEGAVAATNSKGFLLFWKSYDSMDCFDTTDPRHWKIGVLNLRRYLKCFHDSQVVWQRHTQPEPLPFVDDDSVAHNHYFKDVSKLESIDVYQILKLFEVTDPCLQHIVKKALCAGQRGHKDFQHDLQDIFDTAKRALEINNID